MTPERKMMISARVPASLVTRLDFVARNTEHAAVKNRSTAVHVALETWLTAQEDRLRELGVIPKKAVREVGWMPDDFHTRQNPQKKAR